MISCPTSETHCLEQPIIIKGASGVASGASEADREGPSLSGLAGFEGRKNKKLSGLARRKQRAVPTRLDGMKQARHDGMSAGKRNKGRHACPDGSQVPEVGLRIAGLAGQCNMIADLCGDAGRKNGPNKAVRKKIVGLAAEQSKADGLDVGKTWTVPKALYFLLTFNYLPS
jgi:hypothetical protein